MKFDDVIKIEEGIFNRKPKADQMPSISGGDLTYRDQLAHKIFTTNFVSDCLSSIQAGLQSGLIAPAGGADGPDSNIDVDGKTDDGRLIPGFQEKMRRMFNPKMTGHEKYGYYEPSKGNPTAYNNLTGSTDKIWQQYTIKQLKQGGYPANPKGMTDQEIKRAYPGWNGALDENIMESLDYQYVQLDTILESIIDEQIADQRDLYTFLTDWYGQWMAGVDLSKTKGVSNSIIKQIQDQYQKSKNPMKPDINRQLINKLAQAAWGASKSAGVMTAGAKDAGANPKQQKDLEDAIAGDTAPQKKTNGHDDSVDFRVKEGVKLEVGGRQFVFMVNGPNRQWIDVETQQPAQTVYVNALNKYVKENPEYQEDMSVGRPTVDQQELPLGGDNQSSNPTIDTATGKVQGGGGGDRNPEPAEPKSGGSRVKGGEYREPEAKNDEQSFSMSNYPRGAQLQSGGQTYTWHGARWTSKETGRIATRDMAQKLNQYALDQLAKGDVGGTDYSQKDQVAESLTYSSLRAEKIASLKTR